MSTTAEHSTENNRTGSTEQTAGTHTRRTIIFVVVAAACVALTTLVEFSSRPPAIQEFGRVGEEFYPEFTDPTLASSLEVYVFDTEKVRPLDFQVARLPNGRWTIPSHHNYPADAEDQLAQTAASVIGIKRGAMVTRWPADHAHYAVVNPKQDVLNVDEVEGVGKRVILKSDNGDVLADYIIGERVEDTNSNQYYVRHPDESEVYIASLEIDLSTRFADWVDTNLLDITRSKIVEITVNDYSFDELRGVISLRDTSTLHREKSFDPWVLDGLDESVEEVDDDAMRDTLSAIVDMKIVGVRPKQKGLTPELRLDRDVLRSQNDIDRLQSDLLTRGFLLQQDRNTDELSLVAREGELYAATTDGLRYRLHFGRAFAGSQEELEIGLSSGADADTESADSEKPDQDESDDTADEDTDKPSDADESDEEDDDGRPGRYVFIRVEFIEKYLGDRPVKPVEPEMPEELKTAEDSADAGESTNEETAAEGDEDSSDPDDDASDDAETEDPLAEIRRQYEDTKQKYENDLRDFEREQEDYEQKIEDGLTKTQKLNRRFADWYYVIPGASYEKLRLSRANLVKEKEQEEAPDASGDADSTADPFIIPADSPQEQDATPAADTPTDGDPEREEEEPESSQDTSPEGDTVDDASSEDTSLESGG